MTKDKFILERIQLRASQLSKQVQDRERMG